MSNSEPVQEELKVWKTKVGKQVNKSLYEVFVSVIGWRKKKGDWFWAMSS